MSKRILIISLFYPPIQHVATNRVYSFAKYLSQKGHQIIVLTLDKKVPNIWEDDLKNVQVIRVKNLALFRPADFAHKCNPCLHYLKCIYNKILYFFKADEFSDWIEAALPIARKVIREKNIECVISSYPPLAPHILAEKIKIEHPEVQWILDMRDAMSWSPRISLKKKKILEEKERIFLTKADALLSVSKPQLEKFKEKNINSIPMREIRNGFDFPFSICHKRLEKFKIVYTGTFYGKIKPDHFLQALDGLIGKEIGSVEIEMIGTVRPFVIPRALKNIVHIKPRMEYREVIEYIRENATVLLLILPNDLEEGVYSGKIFDYLGSGRPIMGLVPKNGVAGQLILQANAGYVAENENIGEIQSIIIEAYRDWLSHKEFMPRQDIIMAHHRNSQADRLNDLIENLLK